MICEDVQARLTDALLGEAPPFVREELLDHAAGCEVCAGAAEELRQTLDLLAASSWPAEAVLGQAERRRLFERARTRRAPFRWLAAAALLAAAAAVAAAVPRLLRARHEPAPAPPASVARATPAVSPSPAPAAPVPLRVRTPPAVAAPPSAAEREPEPAAAVPAPAPAVAAVVGPNSSPQVPAPRPRRFPEEPDPVVRREGDGRPDGRDAAREPQVAILVQPSRDEWITSGRGRISRFGFDVPSSSLALVRDALLDGRLPEPSAVRVEEFVNAVSGGEPPPESETFAIGLEAARSPFDPARSFLRVGIRAREVPRGDRKPVRLVFVIDLSESMGAEERLGLLKRNLRRLAERLDGGDSIGMVTYGTAARVVLAPTPGDVREGILEAIEGLQPDGSTDADAALRIGYGLAAGAFEFGALNRVVLCTDDGFDGRPLGEAGGLLQQVRGRASAGIELGVLGLGGRGDDALQRLAREGRGPYASVGGDAEARRFLLRDLSQLAGIVARDARVEVALDPARVQAYRLLGSQTTSDAPNRGLRLAAEDAGAVHGGQTVTTLYELRVSPGEGPLGTVRVRFAHPETRDSDEVSRAIRDVAPDRAFDDASARFQLTVLAGRFAEHLRGDRPDEPFRLLHETAQRARPRVSSLDRETEILPMIRAAGRLLGVRE